jgi:hypothetical protein
MKFRSAKQDLRETTLAALPGTPARLEYLAGLRGERGYEHWGLAKAYGREAANAALAEAHGELTAALLRLPLARIFDAAEREEVFERPARELLPPRADALQAAHFNLVWDALGAVARRRRSRRPGA